MLLGTNVKIKPGKKKSKIEIEFYSAEDLGHIIETLTEEAKEYLPVQEDGAKYYCIKVEGIIVSRATKQSLYVLLICDKIIW